LKAAAKHLYPTYVNEGFLSMFGMLTGTASNGMILLREIDPKFETPAANNLVLQTFPAIVLGFPIMLILGYAPQSFKASVITLIVVTVLFIIMAGFIFRKKIFKRRKK
jgi:ESS family glutamate:Na+ symporter